jgi:hypothetical protein
MLQFIDKSLQNVHRLQNLGLIDRTARIIIGAGMISVLFFYPMESINLWLAIIPLLGILPLLSGILGWGPEYELFHTKSCGMDARNPCGTYPDQLVHLFSSNRHK